MKEIQDVLRYLHEANNQTLLHFAAYIEKILEVMNHMYNLIKLS